MKIPSPAILLVLCLHSFTMVQSCYLYYINLYYDVAVTALDNTLTFDCFVEYTYCEDYIVTWWINGTNYHVTNYSALVEEIFINEKVVFENLNITANCFLFYYCDSTLHIKVTADLNNTELYCQAKLADNTMYSSSSVTVVTQGLLEPPPSVQVVELSNGSVELSWEPPFTLSSVPILHYTIYTNNYTTSEQVTVSSTSSRYIFTRPCGSSTFIVSAWNEVGEGTRSNPVTYIRKSLHAQYMSASAPMQLPGTLCISCAFTEESQAHGCFGEVHKTETSTTQIELFNTTRKEEQLSVFHCITGLDTGTYTVKIGEIECTGLQGPMTHVELYNIFVVGIPNEPTPAPNATTCTPTFVSNPVEESTGNEDPAVTSLGVVTALFGVALAACLVVILLIVVYVRKHRTYQLKGPVSPTSNPYNVGSAAAAEERTYETVEESNYETVELQPVPDPRHTLRAGVKPPEIDIGAEPCVAYGFFRR